MIISLPAMSDDEESSFTEAPTSEEITEAKIIYAQAFIVHQRYFGFICLIMTVKLKFDNFS